MTIGIENEGAIVVGMIMGAQTGSAMVNPTGQHRDSMEFIDDFPAFRSESDMRGRLQGIALTDPEERLCPIP